MAADRASRPALADHATGCQPKSRTLCTHASQWVSALTALPLGRPWRPMHHYRVQALARAWQRAIMLRLEGMRDRWRSLQAANGAAINAKLHYAVQAAKQS